MTLCIKSILLILAWTVLFPALMPGADLYSPDIRFALTREGMARGFEEYTDFINFSPVPLKWRDDAKKQTKEAIARYPDSFLAHVVDVVYLVWGLHLYYSDSCHGVNIGRAIVLDVQPGNLTEVVHHEIGHRIYRTFPVQFPEQSWRAINPIDFRYEIEKGKKVSDYTWTLQFDPKGAQKGFLCDYAAFALEEDFCLTLDHLFCPESEKIAEYGKYPALIKKMRLALQFIADVSGTSMADWLDRIDPRMKQLLGHS